GTSSSPIYVTWHDAPAEETGFFANFKYFHTLFYLSCKNADGATTEDEIIDLIWNEFTDHSVINADGLPLNYYKDLYSLNVYLPQLLKDRDGECYTWAMLFLALLKLNGISEPNNYLNIYNEFVSTDCGFGYVDGFMVKTWTFGTPSNFCTDLPYLNVWDYPGYDDTSFIFIYEEVHDEIGVLGQTEANPNSIFGNHQLAIVNGKYYDPCYGNVFDTFDDIKSGSIAGWFYFDYKTEVQLDMDLNGDGDLDASPGYSTMHMTNDIDLTGFEMYITTF
ncbi:MAG: hypothetical protein H7Y00_16925, partial [Fimbriimonadaceae bacterium]|nr:hypothetical protein [Chitinophagales bacterium]